MFRTFPYGRERPYFLGRTLPPHKPNARIRKGQLFPPQPALHGLFPEIRTGPAALAAIVFSWDVRTGGGNRTCFSANKHFFPQMSEREKAIRLVFSAEQPFFPRNIRTGGRKYGLFSVNKCFSGGGNTVCPFRK